MRHSYHPSTHSDGRSDGRLTIRCPHCRKLWATFQKKFEEDYPNFQCSNCYGKFWIPVSLDEISHQSSSGEELGKMSSIGSPSVGAPIFGAPIFGYPHTTPKPTNSLSHSGNSAPLYDHTTKLSVKICPKCSQEVSLAEPACPFCGVVFIKLIEGVTSSIRLKGLWGELLQNWHNEVMHNRFIHACQKENDLIYGVSCYGRVLKEDSNNLKAREMIQKIETLSWFFEDLPTRRSFDYFMWYRMGLRLINKIRARHIANFLVGSVLFGLLAGLFII